MIPTASPQLQKAYALGQSGALALSQPVPGALTVRGAHRLDLLQRMSTNDLSGIAEGQVLPTVLTTAIGRIVDRVLVLLLDEHLILITSPGRGETVLSWLRRHVFFQDDVSLEATLSLKDHEFVMGPRAREVVRPSLEETGPPSPAPGRGFAIPGGFVWTTLPPEPDGVHVLLDSPSAAPALALESAGIEPTAAEEAYQALRIEAGFPEYGREFDDDDIPLEVGLTYAVSFSKGCYLGQEIIARMESRARTPRHLVGARLPRAVPVPYDFPHGRLTSVAFSPRLGWIGLAVVRPEAFNVQISIDGDPIELLELPFPRD